MFNYIGSNSNNLLALRLYDSVLSHASTRFNLIKTGHCGLLVRYDSEL